MLSILVGLGVMAIVIIVNLKLGVLDFSLSDEDEDNKIEIKEIDKLNGTIKDLTCAYETLRIANTYFHEDRTPQELAEIRASMKEIMKFRGDLIMLANNENFRKSLDKMKNPVI